MIFHSDLLKLEGKPIKIFILAGQSNMQGQGVVSMDHPERYNKGLGNLEWAIKNAPSRERMKHLQDKHGRWTKRKDVVVFRMLENGRIKKSPLRIGLTDYQGEEHFGPELQFGHIMGDYFEEPVVLIKTAWGGKSLMVDFRPPSSGGQTGSLYQEILEIIGKTTQEISPNKYQFAGFVWMHGWNDMINDQATDQYESNLINLTKDLRKELGAPDLPVVIGELGNSNNKKFRMIQRTASEKIKNCSFAETASFLRPAEMSPCPGHGHHWFANAESYFLIGESLGKSMRELLSENAPTLSNRYMILQAKEGVTVRAKIINYKKDEIDLLRSDGKKFYNIPISSFINSDQNKIRNTSIYGNLQEDQQKNPIVENGCQLSGYLSVSSEEVPNKYNGGFSIYSSAWSIKVEYPGRHFQSGLFGLWMGAQHDTTPKEKLYSKIEGGLGWWRANRFATPTPKFSMGGVSLNFTGWANGPGEGGGRGLARRDWKNPGGKYGVAQLSPNLLWPPDKLNLKQGTCGELFGYGYLPLPFIDPRSETDGQNIPTGGNCWTLFLNTKNFKGPATFFLPYFFSSPSVKEPQFSGQLLDSRPSKPIGNIALENQNMPCVQSKDRFGFEYAKLAPIVFPRNQPDRSVVANHLKSYTKKALWEGVKKWFEGGPTISGKINTKESYTHQFKARQPSSFKINNRAKEEKFLIDWSILSDPMVDNNDTFSYRWRKGFLEKSSINKNPVFLFPTYFRLEDRGEKSLWVPIDEGEVPQKRAC